LIANDALKHLDTQILGIQASGNQPNLLFETLAWE
jgi:hypothetical protein